MSHALSALPGEKHDPVPSLNSAKDRDLNNRSDKTARIGWDPVESPLRRLKSRSMKIGRGIEYGVVLGWTSRDESSPRVKWRLDFEAVQFGFERIDSEIVPFE